MSAMGNLPGNIAHRTSSFNSLSVQILLVLVVAAVSMFPHATARAAAVGTIPGEFSVDDSGAATYTIPIAVPPGTAGMQPQLALYYSSHGDKGPLGVGWSLAGLPSIHRCPATIAQDGFNSGVSYDANDRFCMDGQRLIAVSGVYGAGGTEYRTEHETFSKVISYGTAGGGPEWFKAWTKAGQIIEFGTTADARIEAQGKAAVRVWAGNKIQDTVGNYLTVSYTENNQSGEYYPARVEYAGHTNGTLPYYAIQFDYEPRPDQETDYYIGGSKVSSTVRITAIAVNAGGSLLWRYRFGYEQGPDQASLLTQVEQCDAEGLCLPATSFTWAKAQGAYSFEAPVSAGQWAYGQLLADVNGDGRADLVGGGFGTAYVRLSNGNGFAAAQSWGSGWGVDATLLGDVNGDGKADLVYPSNSIWYVQKAISSTPNLISGITNGLGATLGVQYKLPSDPTVYTAESDGIFPIRALDTNSPLYLVASYSASDGFGGDHQITYTYTGAKVHLQGRGFLGFRVVEAQDSRTAILTRAEYRQDYPYNGLTAKTENKLNGVVLSRISTTWQNLAAGAVQFPYAQQVVEERFELNGSLVTRVTTTNTYDTYGNPTQIVVATTDGIETFTKTTINTYTNDTANWYLGRLTRAEVTSTLPDYTSQTRVSSFAYDPTTGLLTQEVVEPGTALALTTSYGYDAFGNRTTVTVSGPDIVTRTTTTTYGDQGRFPTGITNALYHHETRTFDPRLGAVTSITGPNGLTTAWAYDGFGRKIREDRADGTFTTWTYGWCTATYPCVGRPANAVYQVTTTTAGAAPVTIYYDQLNRELRRRTLGLNHMVIHQDTEYDALGRISRVSRNYYEGEVIYWTTHTYDLIGRVTTETGPDGGITTYSYAGLSTTITDALNHSTTRIQNSQGQLVQVTDADYRNTYYSYDPFGNLIRVNDAAGNVTTMTYDIRGRKRTMDDPDMGHWEYQYNVLGELIWQKDAKGQIVSFVYDRLGRMTARSEPEGTTTWTYDTAVKGVGKLAQVNGPNGYARAHSYDNLGRPSTVTTTIDGTAYTQQTAYDLYGRVGTTTYPATGFAVRNVYTDLGYLAEVRNAANDALYWRADGANADNQITFETLGNDLQTVRMYDERGLPISISTGAGFGSDVQYLTYQYDALGNLTQRADYRQNVFESFSYDSLNRLTQANIQGVGAISYQYDSIGNLTYKSDVGTYTYGVSGVKPHAVTATSGSQTASYSYDANGNMVSGGGRSIAYTSYNKPHTITKGTVSIAFNYDPERGRLKQIESEAGSTTITYFVDGRYERVIKPTVTEHRHYIYAGKAAVAIYTARSNGTSSTRYLHYDHLGSIDAITDENAQVVERFSFDPFGRSRLANWGYDPAGAFLSQVTSRGYTGHLQLSGVGLVHMGGRVYDPTLGRFLSADPFVQAAADPQSLNRYSYCLNNPLSAVDPSGYFSLKKLFKKAGRFLKKLWDNELVRGVVGILGGVYAYAYFGILTGSKLVASVAAGTVAGGISGGNLKSAVVGGLTAGLFYGIGSALTEWGLPKVLAHGAAGGATNRLRGGSFREGFLSAGFSQLASPYIETFKDVYTRVAAAATIGGAASALGGGKFENGAVTAAFARLFNEEMHRKEPYSRKETVTLDTNMVLHHSEVSGDFWGKMTDFVGNAVGLVRPGAAWSEYDAYYRRIDTMQDRLVYYDGVTHERLGYENIGEEYTVWNMSYSYQEGYSWAGDGYYVRQSSGFLPPELESSYTLIKGK